MIIPVDFTSLHTYIILLIQLLVGYLGWKMIVGMYTQPTALRGVGSMFGALASAIIFCLVPSIVHFLYNVLG